jgi:hypothetical protein
MDRGFTVTVKIFSVLRSFDVILMSKPVYAGTVVFKKFSDACTECQMIWQGLQIYTKYRETLIQVSLMGP